MENNYNLKIKTTQVVESEAFNMDFEMNASYVKINETRYISYIQVDEDTKNKLRTTIKIKPDGVVTIIKGKSEGMILEILTLAIIQLHLAIYCLKFLHLKLQIVLAMMVENLNFNIA